MHPEKVKALNIIYGILKEIGYYRNGLKNKYINTLVHNIRCCQYTHISSIYDLIPFDAHNCLNNIRCNLAGEDIIDAKEQVYPIAGFFIILSELYRKVYADLNRIPYFVTNIPVTDVDPFNRINIPYRRSLHRLFNNGTYTRKVINVLKNHYKPLLDTATNNADAYMGVIIPSKYADVYFHNYDNPTSQLTLQQYQERHHVPS